MDNKKFTKDLLEKIKKENIKQTPSYVFMIKSIFIWFFLISSLFIWSISLGISIDYLLSADLILIKNIWLIKVFIVFLPIFWLIFLIISSFLSYYSYRQTNRAYKLSLLKVFILNIIAYLILAFLLQIWWLSKYIESSLEKYIPKYRSVLVDDKVSRMIKVWQNEDKWLLIWEIIETWKNKLIFEDFNSKRWSIFINDDTKTDIKHRVEIKNWEKIKLLWEKINNNEFKALEIRPFIGRGEIRYWKKKGD